MTTVLSGNHLTIRITADAERIVSARLERRTVDVARLMAGRHASDIPKALSMLLPICAASHGVAATGAIEMARGQEAHDPDARARAVLTERVANGVWRLALDMTAACGMPRRHAAVLSAREAARSLPLDPSRAQETVQTLEHILGDLSDVVEAAQAVAARYPQSTGLEARVTHAAEDPSEALSALRDVLDGRLDPARHAGVEGRVTTSRGDLHHRCNLAGDLATEWTIQTPTDRIAAPGGPLETSLVGLPHGGNPLETTRFVSAVHDPCEEVAVVLEEAGHA